jgi:phosphatidylglycerol:prolipoprotein diacylglycerol transferase
MHAILFQFGSATIYTYGVAYAFSISLVALLSFHRANVEGVPKERFLIAVFLAILGIVLMGKMLHIFVSWTWYMEHPIRLIDFSAGHVLYGGYIGAISFPWIYLKFTKAPILPIYDIPSTYMPLGLAIHRAFGCYNAGCCFGSPTELPWGVVFPENSIPHRVFGTARLHPTQLYESFLSLMIFITLLIWRKKFRKIAGELFALQLLLYALGRFGIEFFRGDAVRGIWGPFSTSQWISIPMIGLAWILAIRIIRKRKTIHTPTQ